jgi:hypothetical protein
MAAFLRTACLLCLGGFFHLNCQRTANKEAFYKRFEGALDSNFLLAMYNISPAMKSPRKYPSISNDFAHFIDGSRPSFSNFTILMCVSRANSKGGSDARIPITKTKRSNVVLELKKLKKNKGYKKNTQRNIAKLTM